jgi:DNA repair protein RadD
MITDGGLFTHIAHDLTSLENFNQLIADGFLSPLIPKKTQVELDVSNVGIQQGEYKLGQLQHEVDKAEITWKGLQELIYYGQNRKSWLIFASGIEHANHIAEMLNKLGINCASVHSKQSMDFNDDAIAAFKRYKLRAIVNYGKLTTGFDHPGIDLIGMFRPTLSVSLWVQMLGRGTRICDGKDNCLVLDFAKNTPRLGPINDPIIPNKKGNKTGDLPVKICEACGVYNHISARKCDPCGHPFEFQIKIVEHAGTEELIKMPEALQIEHFDVSYAVYRKRQKAEKPPYVETTYFCGLNAFKELVFPQSKNRSFFANWWRQRHTSDPPATADEALNYTNELRRPKKIRVHVNRIINGKNYPEILSVEF